MRVLQVGHPFHRANEEFLEFKKRHQIVHLDPAGRDRNTIIQEIKQLVDEKGPFSALYEFCLTILLCNIDSEKTKLRIPWIGAARW